MLDVRFPLYSSASCAGSSNRLGGGLGWWSRVGVSAGHVRVLLVGRKTTTQDQTTDSRSAGGIWTTARIKVMRQRRVVKPDEHQRLGQGRWRHKPKEERGFTSNPPTFCCGLKRCHGVEKVSTSQQINCTSATLNESRTDCNWISVSAVFLPRRQSSSSSPVFFHHLLSLSSIYRLCPWRGFRGNFQKDNPPFFFPRERQEEAEIKKKEEEDERKKRVCCFTWEDNIYLPSCVGHELAAKACDVKSVLRLLTTFECRIIF